MSTTPELHRQFDAQGYAILKAFVEPEVLDVVRAELSRLVDQLAAKLLAEGVIASACHEAPFETRLIGLFERRPDLAPKSFRPELHRPGLFHLFFHPRLLDVVESFLGGEIRLYPNYTARPKLPEHDATRVLWHQDGGYTEKLGAGAPVESLRMINVWTPLVPARVGNGCMQFIPGTHKLGAVPHLKREHYLEIAPGYLETRLAQAVNIELDPGDVVIFHNLLFHQGLPNHSQTVRWSLDWRYQDATQPTLRKEQGHIARSRARPALAVRGADEWARLVFS